MADKIPIRFGTTCYQAAADKVSLEQLINMYPEANPQTCNGPVTLYPSPGLAEITVTGGVPVGGVKAFCFVNNDIFAVIGNHLWQIELGVSGVFTKTDYGAGSALPGDPDPGWLIANETQVAFANVDGIHVATRGVAGFTQVDGLAYNGAAYIDGYGIFTATRTGNFYISNLDDFATINALDFSVADAFPDRLTGCAGVNRELWLFGEATIERWYNAGSAAFPFVRSQGGTIGIGCQSPSSIAVYKDSVYWLGNDNNVYRGSGAGVEQISTPPINALITARTQVSGYDSDDDVFGGAYPQSGHEFYYLTFPALTLVYDIGTKTWHKRLSPADALTTSTHWRPRFVVAAWGRVFAGLDEFSYEAPAATWVGPYLAEILATTYSEVIWSGAAFVATAISRTIDSPPLVAGAEKRAALHEAGVEIQSGGGASGAELLTNGDMATYTNPAAAPDGWSATSGVTASRVTGRSGSGYAMNAAWSNVTNAGISTTTNGPTWVAYGQYLITWYAKAVSGNAVGATADLSWTNSPDKEDAVENPPLTTSWQQYKFRVRIGATPETALKLTIHAAASIAAATAGVMQIDDLSVVREDGAALLLYWSDDGGNTWKGPRPGNIGPSGSYGERAVWTRLGSFANRTLRLVLNEAYRLVVLNAHARIEVRE